MLDEMIEMLPEPKYIMDPEGGAKTYKHQDYMSLALSSLQELVSNTNKYGKSESLERISDLYPELIKEQCLKIVNDAIIAAETQDKAHKSKMIREGKAEKTVGKSWALFNLGLIKELIEEDE